jgi:hypothetical protein
VLATRVAFAAILWAVARWVASPETEFMAPLAERQGKYKTGLAAVFVAATKPPLQFRLLRARALWLRVLWPRLRDDYAYNDYWPYADDSYYGPHVEENRGPACTRKWVNVRVLSHGHYHWRRELQRIFD